jgi:GntR family transcriptional repressor for pyruvate dehydrogenase complex
MRRWKPRRAPASAGAAFVGRPRQRARGLAHGLVEDLGEKIRSQSLRPGDKLPTESAIMQAYGVSRTVVREALSKLQAGGLVETLHGVGTFVLQPRPGGVFRLDPGEIAASVDVLAVLELRISLETESAGLAASRRTDEQLVAMRQALDDFENNVTVAGDTVGPTSAFTCRSRSRPATRISPTSCGTWAPRSFRARASAPSAPGGRGALPEPREPRARRDLRGHCAPRSRVGARRHAHPPDQQPRALRMAQEAAQQGEGRCGGGAGRSGAASSALQRPPR